ncbi:MAG: hypothetical protein IKJ77_05970 [Firmicutes bacterium]|nr:hypothetical protein [Bacillota bacterium]
MDAFQKMIQLELLKQQHMLEEQQQILNTSPEGFLFPRQRKDSISYYHQHKARMGRGWQTVQTNITSDYEMQKLLLDKRLAEKTIRSLQNNIPLLEKMQKQYLSVSLSDLIKGIPANYHDLLREKEQQELKAWQNASYKRCPYYPERLTHRTAFGDYVRSKGEAIIANALYGYGIPNHYEEELFFPDYSRPIYPDFKIRLPHEKYLYWEHWGLLNKEKYRRDNVEKLAAYQANGLIIGHNLIITQDDADGNCQSQVIYDIIEKMILPHFEGMILPRRSI